MPNEECPKDCSKLRFEHNSMLIEIEELKQQNAEQAETIAKLKSGISLSQAELLARIEGLEAENKRLKYMIKRFCSKQGWAAEVWKNQPHVKALFDYAAQRED